MSRPSDGMTMDELRDEFDWMHEFMGNMAERIRGDADVHNLADYVRKLESENAKLREFVQYVADGVYEGLLCCDKCRFFDGCYNSEKKEHDGRGCQWLLWSRELGIEVRDDS